MALLQGLALGPLTHFANGRRAIAAWAGIGNALLEGLADSAREAGYPALSLSVEEDNPALRLYERVGFERHARADGAWTLVLPLA